MRERGFTLIELLVAMVIMALMSLGAFNFLSSTSRSAEHLGERQRDLLALERLQAVIASDLSQWVDRPIRDELGDSLPSFVLATDGSLEFTRRGLSNPLDKQRSEITARLGARSRGAGFPGAAAAARGRSGILRGGDQVCLALSPRYGRNTD